MNYPGIKHLSVPGDGSCFFHAILRGISNYYKTSSTPTIIPTITDFRRQLAARFTPDVYRKLSRGQLPNISKHLPQYSYQQMLDNLLRGSVDNSYNEFVSNLLNIDLYLLDSSTQDVYITGDDGDIMIKDRPSLVLLVSKGHYDLIGLETGTGIQTLFETNSAFITHIRNRVRQHLPQAVSFTTCPITQPSIPTRSSKQPNMVESIQPIQPSTFLDSNQPALTRGTARSVVTIVSPSSLPATTWSPRCL